MKKSENENNPSSGRTRVLRPGSERGVALVLVLVLSMIGLIVMTTVLYVITAGTQLSGAEKRYRTAREAAMGSVDVIRMIVAKQEVIDNPLPGVSVVSQQTFSSTFNGPDMSSDRTIDPDDASTYDFHIDLGRPAYRVYAKIVQLQRGNTSKGYEDELRVGLGVVPTAGLQGGGNAFTYYTITLLAQRATNPNERFRMDVVHIF